ncbi:MAG: hypothetical protein ACUVQ7_03940 [bacterium]
MGDGRDLIRNLYIQGRTRWMIFLIGFAFLLWLWVTAGKTRHPGAIKQSWSVTASRLLAIAGCILYARIVFATREQRVPVLYYNGSSEDTQAILESIEKMMCLKDRGYEDVPIDDIVSFIRENRYVPKKAFGVVIQLKSVDDLKAILVKEMPHITVLIPSEAIMAGSDRSLQLPYSVILGVTAKHKSSIIEDLKEVRRKGEMSFGKPVECALISNADDENLKNLSLRSGYLCFFDGKGFNRFGDRPHLVRLLDVTKVIKSKRYRSNIYLSTQLFMGRFILWPFAFMGGLKRVGK